MTAVIGILDSGVGGLSVAGKLEALLPNVSMTYLGDTARFPYGLRSAPKIVRRVEQGIDFLKDRGADLIVLACVTSSAAWITNRDRKPGVPVVDAVTSAVDQVLKLPRCGSIGVVGTPATIQTGAFTDMIRQKDPDARVYAYATPLLVPLVEDNRLDRPETRMIVKKYLHPLKVRKIDALIMGCNHYNRMDQLMQRKIGKRTTLVDCAIAVADSAAECAEHHLQQGTHPGAGGSRVYYLTDLTDGVLSIGQKMFGRHLTFRHCNL